MNYIRIKTLRNCSFFLFFCLIGNLTIKQLVELIILSYQYIN